jgi:hypothetical protein
METLETLVEKIAKSIVRNPSWMVCVNEFLPDECRLACAIVRWRSWEVSRKKYAVYRYCT